MQEAGWGCISLSCLFACGRLGFDARDDAGAGSTVDGMIPPQGNVAFVTSSLHVPGQLGGLAGGDAICGKRAIDGGHAGTFRAYLSTSMISAVDRFGAARGWYRVDGKPVGDTMADIALSRMIHPMRVDEAGRDLGEVPVDQAATGTYGGVPNSTCGDFTSTSDLVMAGVPQYAGIGFSSRDTPGCDTPARLYCFQTDFTQAVVITPATGRLAFISTMLFDPVTGIASADAICASEAATAGFGGSFRALLSASPSAASRFDETGPPWVRTDGVLLAATASALFDGRVDAPLNRETSGHVTDDYAITGFLAASSLRDPPDPARNCGGWTNAGGGNTFGYAAATGEPWLTITTYDCLTPQRVYCLQE